MGGCGRSPAPSSRGVVWIVWVRVRFDIFYDVQIIWGVGVKGLDCGRFTVSGVIDGGDLL